MGFADPPFLKKGVGAPHQRHLGSVASHLCPSVPLYADVRIF